MHKISIIKKQRDQEFEEIRVRYMSRFGGREGMNIKMKIPSKK